MKIVMTFFWGLSGLMSLIFLVEYVSDPTLRTKVPWAGGATLGYTAVAIATLFGLWDDNDY